VDPEEAEVIYEEQANPSEMPYVDDNGNDHTSFV